MAFCVLYQDSKQEMEHVVYNEMKELPTIEQHFDPKYQEACDEERSREKRFCKVSQTHIK